MIKILISVLFCATQAAAAYGQSLSAYSWNKLPEVREPVFKKDTFNILRYGAVADGMTLNTKSINAAIDACHKAGGGVVLVPVGLWLTGPVEMRSQVNLHVMRGAILLFTTDFDQYPLVEGVYEGRRSARVQSPVFGNNLENIAITGKGVIDGNGDSWRAVGIERLPASEWRKRLRSGGVLSEDGKRWYPSEKSKRAFDEKRTSTMEAGQTLKDFEDIKDFLRPNLVVFNNCKKVLLEGVTFQNSPAWCLHPLLCEDLTVRNINVKNPEYAQNGDGIDVESCRNVLIEGSIFDVGDDAICIKSGKDEEGRKRGKPTENVIVRNNLVYKGHGGFVIGSEMSGGARNIFVYNCSFMGTGNGLRFKTARGRGGIVENIFIRNIYMKDIMGDAILFDMYYFMKPPAKNEVIQVPPVTEATPRFQNFQVSDIVCNGAARGIFIRGLPEMSVQKMSFSNVVLKTDKGAEIIEARDMQFDNVHLFSGETSPVLYVENGFNIGFTGIRYAPETKLLMSVNGTKSGNLTLKNTGGAGLHEQVRFDHGAQESMIVISEK